MTRREQLIEEAARLRRLQASRRGDLAWARLTSGIAEGELTRRSLDIEALQHRAEALEREATAVPEDRAELADLALALNRQRGVLAARARELRRRSDRCRWLAAREEALGAGGRALRLTAEASRLEQDAVRLDDEAAMLPAPLPIAAAGAQGRIASPATQERRRAAAAAWQGPERRLTLA